MPPKQTKPIVGAKSTEGLTRMGSPGTAYFAGAVATRGNPIKGCVFGLLICGCHGVAARLRYPLSDSYQKCSWVDRNRCAWGRGFVAWRGKLFPIGMCVLLICSSPFPYIILTLCCAPRCSSLTNAAPSPDTPGHSTRCSVTYRRGLVRCHHPSAFAAPAGSGAIPGMSLIKKI